MSESVSRALLGILELEQIEVNLFRGQNEPREEHMRLFGGQVLAQSLVAASRTVDADRHAHSVHAYFLRPGDAAVPVIYQVDRIRDGRSFTTRRIKAVQHGAAIFSMDVSFQVEEKGLTHQTDVPRYPGPETLEDDREVAARVAPEPMRAWATRERPFESRSVYPMGEAREDDLSNPVWIRFREPLDPDDHRLQQYLLAYASDMGLVSTALTPHQRGIDRRRMQVASLDHAIWYHKPFRVDDWLLYVKETTTAAAARGFNRGAFYTVDGTLVASTLQEGLMRQHDASEAQQR